ncbi:MAG: PTS sugar transporter subunit IIA [Alphaproteobacteria bacterium]|jgi:mannose PTS system EIIA component|nr:PTS sugar transporter subunit IIA [Alphaproteobacteria bacterium]
MIGLVLVTHGRLADEFLAALEHVVGKQENAEAISIGADDDMELRRADIVAAVSRVGSAEGVVVLTDMFGGTPSNLAISIMDAPGEAMPVEVIAGVNLPMLIRLAGAREQMPLAELVVEARDAGRKYINVASALLVSKDG